MVMGAKKSAKDIKKIETVGQFHLLQIGRLYSCQANGSALFDSKEKENAYRQFDKLLNNHLHLNGLWVGLEFIEQYEEYLDKRYHVSDS